MIKWIQWAFLTSKCEHDFVTEDNEVNHKNFMGDETVRIRVSMICGKCGFNKSFWKY